MKKIIILFSFLFGINYSYGQVNPVDFNALVDFHNSVNGTTGWDLNQPVSTWQGVVLDASDRVIVLNLDNKGLQGSISPSISALANLEVLVLSRNDLINGIPSSITNLANLRFLHLQQNTNLGGTIPTDIGLLTSLTHMDLGHCQLTGSIPNSICNLINLQEVQLNNNQLSNSIPSCIDGLSALQKLNLPFNQLTGFIPTTLCNMTSLNHISFAGNQLSGGIPLCIDNLSNLTFLDLGGNQLSGSIPTSICNLSNLSLFSLSGNLLITGSIPDCIGNLANLEKLYLGVNQLTGTIPASICGLSNLISLSLETNQLTGDIPNCMSTMSSLSIVTLYENCLSGEIPDFSNNQLLGLLVYDNSFTFNSLAQNLSASNFLYFGQGDIPIYNLGGTLHVNAGGDIANNNYAWDDGGGNTLIITGDASFTPSTQGNWTVSVTNSQLPGLTLTGTMNQPINNCAATGNFSDTLNLRVNLQGAFNPTIGIMRTDLLNQGVIPSTQPYNTSPWNYAGIETWNGNIPNIVDWVLITLKTDYLSGSSITARFPALLRSDGQVVDVSGNPNIDFYNTTNQACHIAVEHRNHLGVISTLPVPPINRTYTHDFTDYAAIPPYGGTSPNEQSQQNGIFMMRSGNVLAATNNTVTGDITSQDFSAFLTAVGPLPLPPLYHQADLDMNGDINGGDLPFLTSNYNIFSNLVFQ